MRASSRRISRSARSSRGSARGTSPRASAYASVSGQPEEQLCEGVADRLGHDGADLLGRAQPVSHLVLECAHEANAGVPRAPVAPIDEVLDPRAQRPERHRDGERREGHDPRRAAAHEDAESDRDHDVRGEEDKREGRVDRRAVDDALDRVEAVARDGDADRRGHCHLEEQDEREHDPVDEGVTEDPRRQAAEEQCERDQHGRPGQPHRLEALDPARAAEAEDHRHGAADQARQDAGPEHDPDPSRPGVLDPFRDGVVRQRIRRLRVLAVERARGRAAQSP